MVSGSEQCPASDVIGKLFQTLKKAALVESETQIEKIQNFFINLLRNRNFKIGQNLLAELKSRFGFCK